MNKKLFFFSFLLSFSVNIILFYLFKKISKTKKQEHETNPPELTHFVLMFDSKYTEELYHALSYWNEYVPCSNKTNIELVLYSTENNTVLIKELECEIMNRIGESFFSCFSGVTFHHAGVSKNLTEQEEIRKYMLEKLFSGKIKIKEKKGYFFITDIFFVPIKTNWLEKLKRRVEFSENEFWMMGSINKGNQNLNKELGKEQTEKCSYKAKYFKIHYSAVYNLSDKRFVNICLSVLRDLPQKRKFDTEIYRKIFEDTNFEYSRKYVHKYVYSDFIRVYWKSHIRKTSDENVLFVHNIKGGLLY